jgi:hypothetical protein
VFGLRQFAYLTYIAKGPKPGTLTNHILESMRLYYQYLLESGDIERVPTAVDDIVQNPELFQARLSSFLALEEECREDAGEFDKIFEQWCSNF